MSFRRSGDVLSIAATFLIRRSAWLRSLALDFWEKRLMEKLLLAKDCIRALQLDKERPERHLVAAEAHKMSIISDLWKWKCHVAKAKGERLDQQHEIQALSCVIRRLMRQVEELTQPDTNRSSSA